VWILTTLCCYSYQDSCRNALQRTLKPAFDARISPLYSYPEGWARYR
jgi:hypothetical protein